MSEFERLTKKFGNKTVLPMLPMSEIQCFQDLDDFHKVRREIETKIIRLSEYEDSGVSPSDVSELAQAKADGRLIVLPCKVGESYYGICQEMHHAKRKWKAQRWVETGEILNFHITAELSTTEAEVKQHQRDIDEHSKYWFTGENAKADANAALKRIESKKP